MAITHPTPVRNALADLIAARCNSGTAAATGRIRVFTASFASLLAELNLSNPAFAAAANGTITANAIADDTAADATGTAAVFRIVDRDGVTVLEGTVSASGGGGDMQFISTNFTAGEIVRVLGFTYSASL